jgi:predicted transcriptional regulator
MPNIQEILEKRKAKIEQIKDSQAGVPDTNVRKKIERQKNTRPWQENFGLEQNEEVPLEQPSAKKTITGIHQTLENLGQSSDKLRTEPRTNLGQSSDKLRTKLPGGKFEKEETSDKLKTQLRTEPRTNLGQSSDKLRTKSYFIGLVGLQREITFFLYNQLQMALEKISPPIAISFLAESCKTSVLSAQKTVQRLEKAGIINRVEFKNGRSGWTRYSLNDAIYNEILQNETSDKVRTNLGQTSDKVKTQPRTELRTSLPIVVVPNSLSLKTTTIETEIETPCFLIPNELSGMVSRRQLNQFVLEEKISESELQMSLDAFAYDLRNKLVSTKHTANPVGLLIGAIKNNGGYNSQKFAEALKTEMKTVLKSQQALEDSISEAKTTLGWAKYQEMKTSSPEAFQALVSKYEKQGLKGELLEEFGFLDFQAQELDQNSPSLLDPLRP